MTMHDTGSTMINIWLELARDFRILLQDPTLFSGMQNALKEDITAFRKFDCSEKGEYFYSPMHFKCKRQLEFLLKRFVFEKDSFTDAELQERAYHEFTKTQETVKANSNKPWTPRLWKVLNVARAWVADVLGVYSEPDAMDLCSYSRRATVGNPYGRSYLDVKLGCDSITGSPRQLAWYEGFVMRNPHHEAECFVPPFKHWRDRVAVVQSVPIECVPKSWKALRVIRKNTLVGALATSGIGKLIRKRLKNVGIDLNRAHLRHKKLVVPFSRSRTHVTADLSRASDSFFESVVKYLLPFEWYDAIDIHRIPHTTVGSDEIILSSFMTMGEGHTFPLQTLLFHAILHAIQTLSGVEGLISVYGDDLIYPRPMHRFVVGIFDDLGFALNTDKTFTWENFRESCGEDAYLGMPVRPWNPEGSQRVVTDEKLYQAFIYQCINGLLSRWKPGEIPGTLWFLYLQLGTPEVCQVPPDFPDYSGVRTANILDSSVFPWSPVKLVRGSQENGWLTYYAFRHLQARIGKEVCLSPTPFMVDSLRPVEISDDLELVSLSWLTIRELERLPGPFEVLEDVPRLNWAFVKTKPWTTPNTKERIRYKLVPHYSRKNSFGITYSTSKLAISWLKQ